MMKCLFIFCLLPSVLFAQQKGVIDSLHALFAKEQNDSVRVELLRTIGSTYDRVVLRIDSAMKYYQKAMDLNKQLKNPFLQLKLQINMASVYHRVGNYTEALNLSFATIKKAKEINEKDAVFFGTRQIMWIYGDIGDLQRRLIVAKQIDSLVHSGYFTDTTALKTYKMAIYNILAINYQGLKMLDSAYYYRNLLYHYVKKTNNATGLALATDGLADVHRELNNIDSAFYYHRLSIPYAEKAMRMDLKTNSELAIAKLYKGRKQIDSAFYYAYKSFTQFRSIPDTPKIIDAALLISDLHHNRNRDDSAYFYLSLSTSLKERSLENINIQKARNLLFNETLQQQRLEQQKRDTQQQYQTKLKVFGLLAGVGVLLLLAAVLYRNNRRQQKANLKISAAYAALKKTQAQLVQSEKMASLGELTAGIAHEIQNPLNFVNNFSEVNKELLAEMKQAIQQKEYEEVEAIAGDLEKNEEKIAHHGQRADAIVKSMLQHAGKGNGSKEPTDINQLADEYLRLSYQGLRAKDSSFQSQISTDFDKNIGKVAVTPQDIGRVLLNLFNNAFYAVAEKKKQLNGTFEPVVSVFTKQTSGNVEIRVTDNGTGIPPKAVDKIFQPFFTTKPTGQGTGLGLSLSYDIIKAHGGELKVSTDEGKGTEFTIVLPQNH